MNTSLQLRQLQYLNMLAREQHFGRAAKRLFISQPALSQAIQQIEKHFGTAIVQRHSLGFRGFTKEGEDILAWARQTLVDHDRLVHATGEAVNEDLKGILRIGLAPVAMSIVSLLTSPFNERYPNVTLTVLSRTLPEIERDLRNFEVDVGINYLDAVTKTGLRPYVLYNEAYYLLVPDGHFLSTRKSIGWKEVGELPLCLLTPDLQNRIVLNGIFKKVGVTPQVVIETNCSLGLFAHMRSGKWMTIVPHTYFYLLGDWTLVRSIPIVDPPVTSAMGMLIHETKPVPAVVSAFVEVVEEAQISVQLDRFHK